MTQQEIVPAPSPAVEPARTLSIVALLLGIVGLVLGGTFGAAPLAAIVLGHVALRREPDGRPLAITGLVLGYVGVGFVLLVGLFAALAMVLPFAFLPLVAGIA
ncbi:MAG: hypothetical protein JWP66_1667 [Naasia sp.]|nr:hypothetical protein [Naasia sp.]